MSKISRDKKKAEAKGKRAKSANAPKTKTPKETPKPAIPNADRCCHCKNYRPFPEGVGHMCKLTKKPTPRKATCEKHAFKK